MGKLKDSCIDTDAPQLQLNLWPTDWSEYEQYRIRSGDSILTIAKIPHHGEDRFEQIESHTVIAFEPAECVLPRPSLEPLVRLTDWVPSKKLRKQLRKMLADDAADIQQFHAAGRHDLARWRARWARALWLWYVCKLPLTFVAHLVRSLAR